MNILEMPEAKSHFSGIVDLRREGESWHPERLTQRQLEHYAGIGEARSIRARCAAGVVLRLRTDAPWVDLQFNNLGGARKYLGIDVEVNQRLVESVRLDNHEGRFRQRLLDFSDAPTMLRNICIYFPCSAIMELRRVVIPADATLSTPPVQPKHLLCLGDSITQGMDAVSPYATYPAQLARLLKADLLNQGVGGHVFDEDSLVPPPGLNPHAITIALGTNDWSSGIGVDELHAKVTHYLARLEDMFPEAPTFVISPIWRTIWREKRGGMNLAEFGRLIREISGEFRNIHAIDGFDLVPNQESFFIDGTHPNELGFMYYAINIARHIL